jgi:hypothetical protein
VSQSEENYVRPSTISNERALTDCSPSYVVHSSDLGLGTHLSSAFCHQSEPEPQNPKPEQQEEFVQRTVKSETGTSENRAVRAI